jgi:hypothetical protein
VAADQPRRGSLPDLIEALVPVRLTYARAGGREADPDRQARAAMELLRGLRRAPSRGTARCRAAWRRLGRALAPRVALPHPCGIRG